MDKKHIKIIATIALIFCIYACSDDRAINLADITKQNFDNQSNANFLSRNEVKTEKGTINGKGYQSYRGKKGVGIEINTDYFYFNDGTKANPPFDLELLELLTPKDMILNQKPTVSDGRLLSTGGEIYLKFSKDGKNINSNFGYRIDIHSNKLDNQMKLFAGVPEMNNIINWVPSDSIRNNNDPIENKEFLATNIERRSYSILTGRVGWINVDKFINDTGPKVQLKFTSDYPKVETIIKYLYFPDINSIMQIYGDISGQIPVGQKVTLICFAESTSKILFTQTKNLEISKDETINLKLKQQSEKEFLAFLASLSK